ncbi:glycerol-3-phosphate 1-O-acyltransferase [Trifolium repens]|nr:glycerol-3-phosphate 1-O-acyltransferase [Trifolium repens]
MYYGKLVDIIELDYFGQVLEAVCGGTHGCYHTIFLVDNHLLQLMTTQVIVDEVWYLELQNLKLGETPLSLRKGGSQGILILVLDFPVFYAFECYHDL